MAGSSVGGIFWPTIINSLIRDVGEPTTHRIMAAMCSPLLVLATILVIENANAPRFNSRGRRLRGRRQTNLEGMLGENFLAISFALLFIYFGMNVPVALMPLFAERNGLPPTAASNMPALCYAFAGMGQIGSGWLADQIGR